MTRILRIALAGLILCSGTWTVGDAPAQTSKKDPIVVRLGHRVYVSVIDPVYTNSHGTRDHAFLIYDQLFGVDNKMQPHPQMVDTWTRSNDGLTYTFTLRDGLKFHDGADVTAADCVASIKRWAQVAEMGKQIVDRLAAIEARDKKTFVIRLTRPFGLLIDALASPDGTVLFIMPERIAGSTPPDKQITDLTGSGPFKVKERVVNSHTVYEKFADYRPRPEPPDGLSGGKVVKMDLLEWRGMSDENTRMAALLAGEVDYVHQPPLTLVPTYQKNPNVVVKLVMLNGQQGYIQFNHLLPPVRQQEGTGGSVVSQSEGVHQDDLRGERVRQGELLHLRQWLAALHAGRHRAAQEQQLREVQAAAQGSRLRRPTGDAARRDRRVPGARRGALDRGRPPQGRLQRQRRPGGQLDEGAAALRPEAARRGRLEHPHLRADPRRHRLAPHPPLHPGRREGRLRQEGAARMAVLPELGKLIDAFAEEPDAAKRKELARQIQVMALDHVAYLYYSEYFEPAAMRKELKGVLEAPVPVFWGMTK